MKTVKTAGAKSAKQSVKQFEKQLAEDHEARAALKPLTPSALGEFASRVRTADDKPWPFRERLVRWQDMEHGTMVDKSMLQFEARTRIDHEQIIETLFYCYERGEFILYRSEVRGEDWGESARVLNAQEAVLWGIDRLFGPAMFEAAKQVISATEDSNATRKAYMAKQAARNKAMKGGAR